MAGSENAFTSTSIKGLKNANELTDALLQIVPSHLTNDDIVYLCIGTDRCTGDSLAPLVGTFLESIGYTNVVGTLDLPCHAVNLSECIKSIDSSKTIIAIDACLGKESSVGTLSAINGSIKPGAGVNKDLGSVGDYSIAGVVNVSGFMEYMVLQNTRLSLIMRMAKDIVTAIATVLPINMNNTFESNVINFSSRKQLVKVL